MVIYATQHLEQKIDIFSRDGIEAFFEINNIVQVGLSTSTRFEYRYSEREARRHFYENINLVQKWYNKNNAHSVDTFDLAAQISVRILSCPQLFIEGNHRSSTIVANWINLQHGYPPFVLDSENAVEYFKFSDDAKYKANKNTWIGRLILNKYSNSFKEFMEKNVNCKYIRKGPIDENIYKVKPALKLENY